MKLLIAIYLLSLASTVSIGKGYPPLFFSYSWLYDNITSPKKIKSDDLISEAEEEWVKEIRANRDMGLLIRKKITKGELPLV